MKSKKIQIIFLTALFLGQLFILGNMAYQHDQIASSGEQLKFRIRPVDPHDPFRGKYITLDFEDDSSPIQWNESLFSNGKTFVQFEVAEDGYARIAHIQGHAFANGPYLELPTESIRKRYKGNVYVDFPFDRFYMEESKAPRAERELRANPQNEELESYALVAFKNGKAVLLDVVVGEKSIKDFVQDVSP